MIHYTPRWPLVVHFSCAIFCFAMSAIYHLFNSHSKKMMTFWIRFDYAGICLMIAGSSTPPIYYSFACEQLEEWRFFYLGLIYTFGLITFTLMMIPYFDQDHLAPLRSFMFSCFGLSPIIPVMHIVWIVDPQYINHFHLGPWLGGGFFYVLGASLYATHFPEKCCPNRFDFFGNSHNLFHILIIIAGLMHYYGSI